VSESQLACRVRRAMPPLSSPIFLPRAQDVNAESPPWEPSTQLYTEPCRSCHLWTHRSLEVLRVRRPHLSSAVVLRVQVEQPSVSSTTVFPRCRPVAKTRRVPFPRASAPLFQSFTSCHRQSPLSAASAAVAGTAVATATTLKRYVRTSAPGRA
jgi:hypothetical protein